MTKCSIKTYSTTSGDGQDYPPPTLPIQKMNLEQFLRKETSRIKAVWSISHPSLYNRYREHIRTTFNLSPSNTRSYALAYAIHMQHVLWLLSYFIFGEIYKMYFQNDIFVIVYLPVKIIFTKQINPFP